MTVPEPTAPGMLLCAYCEDPPHPRCSCLHVTEYRWDAKRGKALWWCPICNEEVPSNERHEHIDEEESP